MLAARSEQECLLYLELRPCSCGDAALPAEFGAERAGAVVRYSGRCRACGRDHEYSFTLTGAPASLIIDPGEFLWLSTLLVNEIEQPDDDRDWEPETLRRACRLHARSLELVDEVLRFLPPGSGEIPARAFGSELGRAVRWSNPEWFTAAGLTALRTARDRRLATLRDRLAAVDRTTRDAFPLIRSTDERLLHEELHPCGCGEPGSTLVRATAPDPSAPDRMVERRRCSGCGTERVFRFRYSGTLLEFGLKTTGSFGGPEPSELIDAGEWLWVAETAASRCYSERPDLLSERELARNVEDMTVAVAAVEEVLKFIPAGARPDPDDPLGDFEGPSVPAGAFWTPLGRRMRAGQLDSSFRRHMLEISLDTYRTGLRQLTGSD